MAFSGGLAGPWRRLLVAVVMASILIGVGPSDISAASTASSSRREQYALKGILITPAAGEIPWSAELEASASSFHGTVFLEQGRQVELSGVVEGQDLQAIITFEGARLGVLNARLSGRELSATCRLEGGREVSGSITWKGRTQFGRELDVAETLLALHGSIAR